MDEVKIYKFGQKIRILGKLQQLARFGFYFTKPDGRTCDPEAVQKAQLAMERGEVVNSNSKIGVF